MKDLFLILVLTTLLFLGKQSLALRAEVRETLPNAATRDDRAELARLRRLPDGFELTLPGGSATHCASLADVCRRLFEAPGVSLSFLVEDAEMLAAMRELTRVTPHINVTFSK